MISILNFDFTLFMAPNVSKNAKTNRTATTKNVVMYNGKEVEVVPARFIGKAIGFRNYMAVQDKASKTLLLDANGVPLEWNKASIERKKIA